MACRLIVSDLANDDLDEIIGYMVNELKSRDAAANLLDEIELCYENLKTNPLMYAKCTDGRLERLGYRKAVIKNYLLLYRFDEATNTVQVVRFFYGARNYGEYL